MLKNVAAIPVATAKTALLHFDSFDVFLRSHYCSVQENVYLKMLKNVPAFLAGTTKTAVLYSDCIVELLRSHYCSVYYKIDLSMLKTVPEILAGTSPLTLMHSLLLFRCTQLVYYTLPHFWHFERLCMFLYMQLNGNL